ncbi:polysaccharide biosynthesis tyrosine autokinase [Winogradskyella sp. 3972H.M.0a.05]|uniref:GumC family protein n=1 Tax=Winogradskyella sp. 3972H.M.0a.05 TaxID=2950277 RepID=UPI0033964451
MNKPQNNDMSNFLEDNESIDFALEAKKYLRFWPWFAIALFVCLVGAYVYLRYATPIYQTTAKIKILDESEGLELPTSAFVFKRVNINLENEIEILKSYLILERVVQKLNLNANIFEEGRIRTSRVKEPPFQFEQLIKSDNINRALNFEVEVNKTGFEILDVKNDKTFSVPNHNTYLLDHNLPFEIRISGEDQLSRVLGKKFLIKLNTVKSEVLKLKSSIKIEAIGEQSDLLQLTLKGQSKKRTEQIINTLINIFDQDGINDRQLVSKRTLDFIDERFVFLAKELDSIEIDKKDFKQDNNIVDLVSDAQIGLEQRAQSDEQVFNIERQIELTSLLQETLNDESKNSKLLPANIGLENNNINAIISEYNIAVLDLEKLVASAGNNNPSVKLLESKITTLRFNLDRSLIAYDKQLKSSENQLVNRNQRFKGRVSSIPQKEKLLRAIERQQKIKESLYLLLLQKREEAAINLAITEPSIKVVEFALSGIGPISPKTKIIYSGAILAGLLLPFAILYLMFMLDTKLHSKEDISKLKSSIPIVGEIPSIKSKGSKIFEDPNDRSILAESFRILSSNVNYMLPTSKDTKGKIIYCTSTIKGEGKTYVSVNLSLALSSINKKVLLIGSDLRNPQVHTYMDIDKSQEGLTNYLHDKSVNWRDILIKGFDLHANHHTIISGPIPPNPAHLLTNGRFNELIEEAKEEYDYVIVDTAPTILVTDTMLISQLADTTIFITRANFTQKNLLNFSKELSESGKLKNMAYVLNGVGASKSYNYSYNYGYGYGYGSKE